MSKTKKTRKQGGSVHNWGGKINGRGQRMMSKIRKGIKKQDLKTKGLKYWKKKAWIAFSIMIRVLHSQPDGRCQCYTCGKIFHWKELQAGHFTAGRGNSVLFDERQVRPQCYSCNVCNHGEQFIFGEKLRKEAGEKVFSEILKDKHKSVKYTAKDYQRLETEFKEKTQLLVQYKDFSL